MLSGELKAGEKVRLSFLVINGGESLDTPFNATIELVQGDQRSMLGRAIFYSMDANTATSVKRSFTAPEGAWTLEITVDKEGLVWEIDETNNLWSRAVSGSSSGFGSTTVLLGGSGLLALAGVGVLLRRRGQEHVEEEKVVAALEATGETVVSSTEVKPPAQPPAKRRGPPGGKVASKSGKTPARGPPRGPPKTSKSQSELTPQELAAMHMAALGTPEPTGTEDRERVEDYSKLPGGGDYEYTAEATYYVGPTCGRWVLNEDKSFTKITDEV